jgi:hypothetical protein
MSLHLRKKMKKLLVLFILCCITYGSMAQVAYYRAEWTKKDNNELFTAICKITTDQQNVITGELVWTYLACDSSDQIMMDMYKGKKGKMGIEFVEGNYAATTHDVIFNGTRKDDPDEVIGEDKYTLKLSANKQVLYGTTWANGTNNGLFYATKLPAAAAEKEFMLARAKIKKETK